MANHFAVRVVALDAGDVALELRALHPDAGRPDATATFALNLVLDQWWRVVRHHDLRREFEENLADAKARPGGPPWDSRLEPLYEASFGAELEVTREEYEQARREQRFRGREVRGSGWSGPRDAPRYKVRVRGDWDEFQRLAAATVRDVRAVDPINEGAYAEWPDEGDDPAQRAAYEAACPRVTLRFTVAPPELVAFLRVGMTWETAVYR